MDYEIHCRPSYSLLEVTLDPGEVLVAEAGAMAWMDAHVEVRTMARSGVLSSLKRSLLTKESFFQNEFEARDRPGRVGLVQGSPGDIVAIELRGDSLFLEAGAFIASSPGVQCDTSFEGLKGLFSEGMFVLRVSGEGLLFFGAYGHIREIEVEGDYVVDNGYVVAWDPTLRYRIERARKVRSFLFSDQLLTHFSGRGRLWLQSHSPRALAAWVHPFRRQTSSE